MPDPPRPRRRSRTGRRADEEKNERQRHNYPAHPSTPSQRSFATTSITCHTPPSETRVALLSRVTNIFIQDDPCSGVDNYCVVNRTVDYRRCPDARRFQDGIVLVQSTGREPNDLAIIPPSCDRCAAPDREQRHSRIEPSRGVLGLADRSQQARCASTHRYGVQDRLFLGGHRGRRCGGRRRGGGRGRGLGGRCVAASSSAAGQGQRGEGHQGSDQSPATGSPTSCHLSPRISRRTPPGAAAIGSRRAVKPAAPSSIRWVPPHRWR